MNHKLIMESWRAFINEDFTEYGEEGRGKLRTIYDRNRKRRWNKKADHDFFNNEVIKVHWVGATRGLRTKEQPASHTLETALLDNLKTWNVGAVNKDELSVTGTTKLPLTPYSMMVPYGLLIDGYVSYARDSDAQTEWTAGTDEEHIKKYAASGLPKRAYLRGGEMYGREDFVESADAEGGYNELVVDNWKISGFIFSFDLNDHMSAYNLIPSGILSGGEIGRGQLRIRRNKPHPIEVYNARINELHLIKQFCDQNNISFLDFNLKPFQIPELIDYTPPEEESPDV